MHSCKFFVFIFLGLFSTFTTAETRTLNNLWFNNADCGLIEINKFKSISDRRVIKSISIEDTEAIKRLMNRIAQLPANGDMMKKFGPNAEEIDLVLHCGNQKQIIGIFEHQFKTPSTGFNSEKNKIEEDLYRDIDALLFPDFNKRIPKIKNLFLPFKGFTVVYKGSSIEDFAPASIQMTTQRFLIKDNKLGQNIEIKSGQTAPQPISVNLHLNKTLPITSKITLNTYQSRQGEDLYPDYFQIIKQ